MQIITLGPLALDAKLLAGVLALTAMFIVAGIYERRQYIKIELYLWLLAAFSLLCGRLVFVLKYWKDYQANWLGIANIRDGGFYWQAAALTALISLLVLGYRKAEIRKGLVVSVTALVASFSILTATTHWLIPIEAERMPIVTLQTLQQEPVSLIEFEGKPIVLNLWATWCPPCRREMPVLQQAQNDFPEVHFIFANQAESAAIVEHFLSENNLKLENVLLDTQTTLAHKVKSRGLPTTLFIDSNGKVQGYRMGELSAASLHSYLHNLE